MKKKCIRQIICAVLFLFITIVQMRAVMAAAKPEAVSYFTQGEALYVFCDMKERGTQGITVKKFDSSPETLTVQSLANESGTVHYVLVIDISSSMNRHWKEVRRFVETLISENENKDLKVTYTLATIGEAYNPLLERADDGDKVLNTMETSLFYTEERSNLYKGIVAALNYLNRIERQDGELTDLIIISDNILYNASEYPTKEDTKELLTAKKENLVQTVGMNGKIELGFMHYSGEDEEKAATSATDITNYICNLSRIRFLQKTGTANFNFYFQEEGKQVNCLIKLTDIPNVERLTNTSNGRQSLEDGEGKPDTSSEPTTEPQGDNEKGQTNDTQKGDEKKELKQSVLKYAPLIGILVGAILACGLFLFFRTKAKKKQNATESLGIPVELEVLSGRCTTKRKRFYLTQELIIGSAANCDIVFDSKAVSARNTRVFLQKGNIYIEDLKSSRGTAIGGMRIYAPNILRSGEVISIERVAFKLIYSSEK